MSFLQVEMTFLSRTPRLQQITSVPTPILTTHTEPSTAMNSFVLTSVL